MLGLQMFTYATAIARIGGNPKPVWSPGMTDAQKLQRLNEVIEMFWLYGDWDGLSYDVTLTTSGGVITLPPQFRSLEALTVPSLGANVSIKQQQWKFTQSTYPRDWATGGGCELVALDLGETGVYSYTNIIRDGVTGEYLKLVVNNGIIGYETAVGSLPSYTGVIQDGVTGALYAVVITDGTLGINDVGVTLPVGAAASRQYQISGDAAYVDTLTFVGSARRRYSWVSDTATLVVPDCYPAIDEGIRAFHWKDEGDNQRFSDDFLKALDRLQKDMGVISDQEDWGYLNMEQSTSGGAVLNIP